MKLIVYYLMVLLSLFSFSLSSQTTMCKPVRDSIHNWTNLSFFDLGLVIHGSQIGNQFDVLKFNKGIINGKMGLGFTLIESIYYKTSDDESFTKHYFIPLEVTFPILNHWKSKSSSRYYSNAGVQLKIWQSTKAQSIINNKKDKTVIFENDQSIILNRNFKETRLSVVGYYSIFTVEAGIALEWDRLKNFNMNNQAFIKLNIGIPGSMKFIGNSAKNKKSQTKHKDFINSNVETEKTESILKPNDPINLSETSINSSASKETPTKIEIIENSSKINQSFICPIENGLFTISSYYGYRSHPVWGRTIFHNGIDLFCKTGTKILASNDGYVLETGFSNTYGNYLVISHKGEYKTLYAHLYRIYSKSGEKVSQGQCIGTSGNTGLSTGPHLHFEILLNDKNLDPILFLNLISK